MNKRQRHTSESERRREDMMEHEGDDLGFKMHRKPRTAINWGVLAVFLLAALAIPLLYLLIGVASSMASTGVGLILTSVFLLVLVGAAAVAVYAMMQRAPNGTRRHKIIPEEQADINEMTKKVSDLMVRDPVVCGNLDSIVECARIMYKSNVGATMVIDADDNCVGIVTDRDIVCGAVAQGVDVATTPITIVMERNFKYVRPAQDLADVLETMRDSGIRRIPVLENRQCIGVISLDDLIARRIVDEEDIAPIFAKQLSEPGPSTGLRVNDDKVA